MTGEELRKHRVYCGFTQRGLAEALGYKGRAGECTVQNWEYDKQPIPVKHYRRLARLLRLSLDDMIPPEEYDEAPTP